MIRNRSLLTALLLGAVLVWLGAPATADDSARGLLAGKTITGMVVDAAGAPVANAKVMLIQRSKTAGPQRRGPNDSPTGDSVIGVPDASPLQKAPGTLGPGEKEVKPAVTTDSTGKFQFTDVSKGQYQLMAVSGKLEVRVPCIIRDEIPTVPPFKLQLPKA
jgi:hypothetical protein